MEYEFNIGEIVRVSLKTAFYQIVAERNGEQVYIRQVFDKNLKFKIRKAELCHKGWLYNVSKNYKEKLSVLLNENPDIKEKIDDLTLDPAFHYGTGYGNWHTTFYYINNSEFPALQKKLSYEIEKEPTDEKLNSLLTEFQNQKLIEPVPIHGKIRKTGESIYRLECGRYENDFDENDNETFRAARFYRVKYFEENN